MVDRQHPRLDPGGNLALGAHAVGEEIGGKAIGQAVGFGQRGVDIVHRRHQHQRPERLLVHRPHLRRHAGQDRRLEEEAAIADARSAGFQLRAALHGIRAQRLDLGELARGGERSHLRIGIHAVADSHIFRRLDHASEEIRIERLFHQKTGRRHADLPGIAIFELGRQRHERIQIGIARDDHRIMPAQLHRHLLEMLSRRARQQTPDAGGAGERHLMDFRRGAQRSGNGGRIAPEHGQHPGRQAGGQQRAGDPPARAWRFLGDLEHHRASRAQRGRDLLHRRPGGEIPGRERGDRADRAAMHRPAHIRRPARDQAAISAAPFLGEPIEQIGRTQPFTARLRQRLALLARHLRGSLIGFRPHDIGGETHDPAALKGRHGRPDRKTIDGEAGGLQRFGLAAFGRDGDHLSSGGVDHLHRAERPVIAFLSIDNRAWRRHDPLPLLSCATGLAAME